MSSEFRFAVFTFLALIMTTWTVGQESAKSLTVEEIVTRHEATWSKLERFSVKLQEKAKVHCCSMGKEENGKPVYYTSFPIRNAESEVHCIGLRQFAKVVYLRDGADRERIEVWIRDDGVIKRSSQGSVEIWNEGNSCPKIPNSFGRTVDRTVPANTTLRKWIETARPEVTTSKNDAGETLYQLRGQIESKLPVGQDPIANQTDDLTVTINATKGFLIEKMEYCNLSKDGLRDMTWQVQSWREVGDELSFPGQFRGDCEGEGKIEDTWSEYQVVEFTLNPVDIEERFVYRVPAGAQVTNHDYKNHPGAAYISIWGADDKPARTFATYEEFNAYRDLEWAKLQAKGTEEWAATLFPDCKVTTTYVPVTKTMMTVVTAKDGEVLQTFGTEEELHYFDFMQRIIVAALGGEMKHR